MTTATTNKKPATKELKETPERSAEGIECTCGGYAKKVDSTKAERDKYGCGRPWDCCNVAFLCKLCNTRLVGKQAAPEME